MPSATSVSYVCKLVTAASSCSGFKTSDMSRNIASVWKLYIVKEKAIYPGKS